MSKPPLVTLWEQCWMWTTSKANSKVDSAVRQRSRKTKHGVGHLERNQSHTFPCNTRYSTGEAVFKHPQKKRGTHTHAHSKTLYTHKLLHNGSYIHQSSSHSFSQHDLFRLDEMFASRQMMHSVYYNTWQIWCIFDVFDAKSFVFLSAVKQGFMVYGL